MYATYSSQLLSQHETSSACYDDTEDEKNVYLFSITLFLLLIRSI